MATLNNCRKFSANIFDKSKCQNCFKPKETHSAEALECNKISRKISKCAYLFVAPDTFDFSNALDKTRRWQRRFFVLYDDGELTYSVDENVNTVPQGVIDMNVCTDVYDAENATGHGFSICVATADKKTFIKGTTKEEITRWFDVLVMYPRSLKTKQKHRRTPTYPKSKEPPRVQDGDESASAKRIRYHSMFAATVGTWDNQENAAPEDSDSDMYIESADVSRPSRGLTRSRSDRVVSSSKEGAGGAAPETPAIHYRGIRGLKHKHDRHYQDGLKKSSSVHDIPSNEAEPSRREGEEQEEEPRMRSRSSDRSHSNQSRLARRRTDPHPALIPTASAAPSGRAASPPVTLPTRPAYAEGRSAGDMAESRDSSTVSDKRGGAAVGDKRATAVATSVESNLYRSRSPTSSLLLNGRNKNETDEHKMAKTLTRESSSPRQSPSRGGDDSRAQDDLKYMKKGWLLKQRVSETDGLKHWFVLSGTSLKYFKDSRAEELNLADGVIDLTSCEEISEVNVTRNYGFKIKTAEGEYVLSAMTSGIRVNWMQAIQKCVESSNGFGTQPSSALNSRQASLPEGPVSQSSLSHDPLSQSYPAVRFRPKTRDTRQRLQQQENRHSLDLSTLEGQGQGHREEPLNRRLTMDDYSLLVRQLDAEGLKRQDSQDSLQSTQSGDGTMERTPRRRRRDKQHKHRISCTWPYEAGSSQEGAPPEGVTIGLQDSVFYSKVPPAFRKLQRSKSELSEYVGKEEKGIRQRKLSAEEHTQLDNVEKNIRSIHRKSLTETGQQKPQHFDKFETGSAFKEEIRQERKIPLSERIMSDLALSEEDVERSMAHRVTAARLSRERSPSSSSQSSSPAARGLDAVSSPRHMHKSATAQVKEKAKTKTRSAGGQDHADRADDAVNVEVVRDVDSTDDIIEQKWRERHLSGASEDNVTEVESSGASKLSSTGGLVAHSSSLAGETTLRSLLETEVETLKAKLERTQSALDESQKSNSALQAKLYAARNERDTSLSDMETDQSRYVSQMHDLQDQMEHSAEYFQSKLLEQENRNEMTKLQVQSLRSQLQEARDTVATQQEEISGLKAKVDTTSKEMTLNKSLLGETVQEQKQQEKNLQQIIVALEKKVRLLESDIEAHTTSLAKRDHELSQYKDTVRHYVSEAAEKDDRIESLEAEIHELIALRQEVDEKSDLIGHLSEELELSKQQLRKQDGVMQRSEKDFNQRVKEMEDEFYHEKEKMESTIEQYKVRLEQVLQQSNMADTMTSDMQVAAKEKDETIAQLEERVIENDTKLVELKEELGEVIEENTKLQQGLAAAYHSTDSVKSELEQSRKEATRLKNQLASVNSDIEQMKMKKDSLADDKATLSARVHELQAEVTSHKQESARNQQLLTDLTADMQDMNDRYMAKIDECERLRKAAAVHVDIEDRLVKTHNELELARGQIAELESQLSQQASSTSGSAEGMEEAEAKLAEYQRQAVAWQDKYIEKCDECERLRESSLRDDDEVRMRHEKAVADLAVARQQVAQLQRELKERQQSFDRELENRCKEVSESQSVVAELQERLSENEKAFRDQSAELADMREKELLSRGAATPETSGLSETEANQKYKDAVKHLKQTRQLAQETARKRDEVDQYNAKLKQELRTMEMNFEEQSASSRKKIAELTSKLQASERRIKRLDKRRSSATPLEDEFKTICTQTEGLTKSRDDSVDQSLALKIHTLEAALSSAEQRVAEFSELKRELVISQARNRDMSKQVLEHRRTEIDLSKLKESEIKFRDKNAQLEKDIVSLRSQLEIVKDSEFKDSTDIVGRLLEVEMRVRDMLSSLGDCQSKLGSTIGQLKSRGMGEFTNQLAEINKEIEKLVEQGGGADTCGSEAGAVAQLSDSERTRIYAEKLALEALVLNELAYNVKVNECDLFSSQDNVLYELESAKHRVLSLQQTVSSLDAQYGLGICKHPVESDVTSDNSLEHLSGLLAQKINLQHQISNIIQTEHATSSLDGSMSHVNDVTVDVLGQEALFRVFTDERLMMESSHLFVPLSIFPRIMVHSDLARIQAKVKDNLTGSLSESGKQRIVQGEIDSLHEWIKSEQTQLANDMDSAMDALIDRLARLCALDVVNTAEMCQSELANESQCELSLADLILRVFDREQIKTELTLMVNKFAHSSQIATASDKSREKTAVVIECVQKETSLLCQKLLGAMEHLLDQFESLPQRCDQDRVQDQKRRNTLALELCKLTAQCSLVNAQVSHVHRLLADSPKTDTDSKSEFKLPLRRNDSGVVVHSISLPTSPVELMHEKLALSLQQEAVAKSDIASYLINNTSNRESKPSGGSLKEQIALLARELIGVERSLAHSDKLVGIYSDYMCREAILQAQMSFTTSLLHLRHQQQLENLKTELESAHEEETEKLEKHMLTLKIQIAEIQQEKQEIESLRMRETDHAQEQLYEIARKECSFEQEVQALKDGHDIRIKSLQSDLSKAKSDLEAAQQERYESDCRKHAHIETLENDLRQKKEELERIENLAREEQERFQSVVKDLEQRIAAQEEESVQVKDDMRLAVKAVSNHEVEALEDQVLRLRQQLEQERNSHVSEIERLREEISKDTETAAQAIQNSKIQQLEQTIQNLQADYEAELNISRNAHRRELARSKDDMLSQLAAAEASSLHIDEDTIRKRYMKEIERIKEIYDKSFGAMEKSHQKVLMQMRRAHKRELDALRQEKDQVLEEETKATQAALDAMRKAHEAELQKERSKFLDMLAKTYSHSELESIQKQHEDNLDVLQGELHKLSEQYSIRCLETESLRKRLELQTGMLHDSRKRAQDLIAKNDELNLRLRHDIDKLNRMVTKSGASHLSPIKKDSEPPEMYDLRVVLKVKEAEIGQLSDELDSCKEQLQAMSQELDTSVEKYSELYDEHVTTRRHLEAELERVGRRLQDVTMHRGSPHGSEHGSQDSRESPDPEEDSRFSDDSGERSPSPKRSKVRGDDVVLGATGGRLLPSVPPDVRSKKQTMWRQRRPERARSNPGPVSSVLSTPPPPPEVLSGGEGSDLGTRSLDRKNRKKLARIVDVDIIEEL